MTETQIRPCPRCGSTATAQVLYGYPTEEMAELEQRGEIILGGCMPPVGEEPDFYCRGCGSALPWVAPDRDAWN